MMQGGLSPPPRATPPPPVGDAHGLNHRGALGSGMTGWPKVLGPRGPLRTPVVQSKTLGICPSICGPLGNVVSFLWLLLTMHFVCASRAQHHSPTVTHGFSRNLIMIIEVKLIWIVVIPGIVFEVYADQIESSLRSMYHVMHMQYVRFELSGVLWSSGRSTSMHVVCSMAGFTFRFGVRETAVDVVKSLVNVIKIVYHQWYMV